MDSGGGSRCRGGLLEEGGLAAIGLNEVKMNAGRNGKNQPGKSGSRSEINRLGCPGWDMGRELECVIEVTFLKVKDVRRTHEFDGGIPAREECGVST